jgi:hypothetical protein
MLADTEGDSRAEVTMAHAASPWAIERFGALAGELVRRVPEALAATVAHATEAHHASTLKTKHAFGSTRWALQYDELCKHLRGLDEVSEVRPARAFYRLVVAAGNLLLPWRYAEDHAVSLDDARAVRSMRLLTRELLTRFGPAPQWRQEPLFDVEDDDDAQDVAGISDALEELDPPPRPVLIAYACNPTDGLLELHWGEASLSDGSILHWSYREPLPLLS